MQGIEKNQFANKSSKRQLLYFEHVSIRNNVIMEIFEDFT